MDSREAYKQLQAGERVRLPHWPEGQYLKQRRFGCQPGDTDVAVYREFAVSGLHHSPSNSELDSKQWEVYALPEGAAERDTVC